MKRAGFSSFLLLFFYLAIAVLISLTNCGMPPKEKALSILNKGLQDESVIIRINAAQGLQTIGDKRGIEFLYSVLREKDDDRDALVAAITALYELKEEHSSPIIIKLTTNEHPLIRTEAFRLISVMVDTACQQVLLKGTKDKIAKIRMFAYEGLVKYRRAETIQNGLRDNDVLVRIAAAKALGMMRVQGMENFIRKELNPKNPNPEIWSRGTLALADLADTSLVSFIKDLLVDTPWDLRVSAVEALLVLKNHEGIDVLKQALQTSDPFIRVKAVEIVKRFPLPEVYEMVKEATADRYINVSIRAIEALKAYRKKESVLVFEKLMDAPNPLLKIAAATAYLSSTGK